MSLLHHIGFLVANGTTKWTAKGLYERMEEQGWNLVSEIENLHKEMKISYDWSDFRQLIDDFKQFSQDKKLVDRYGLPKNAGKDIELVMRAKLRNCLAEMRKV